MVNHIVMWKFKPEIKDSEKEQLKKAEDIPVYAKHPDHVYVADNFVRPYVTERACLDY